MISRYRPLQDCMLLRRNGLVDQVSILAIPLLHEARTSDGLQPEP